MEEPGQEKRRIPVRKGLVFGRGSTKKGYVGLGDRAASRNHAGIYTGGEGWVLRAINARNPLKARAEDGSWVEAQDIDLKPGVVFLIGREVRCTVCEDEPSAEEFDDDEAETERRGAVGRAEKKSVVPQKREAQKEPEKSVERAPEVEGSGSGGDAGGAKSTQDPAPPAERKKITPPPSPPPAAADDPFGEVTFDPTIDRGQRRSPVADLMSSNPRIVVAADGFRDTIIELAPQFQKDQTGAHWCYFGADGRKAEKRGQRTDCEIKHGNLSSPHFAIVFKDGRFFVSDCGSTNRTYIRGRGRGTDYSANEKAAELIPFRLEELSPETYLNLADTIDLLFFTRVDSEQETWHGKVLRELVDRNKITKKQAGRIKKRFQEGDEDHLGAFLLREAYIEPADWIRGVDQAIQLSPFHKREEKLKWILIVFGLIVVALVGVISWIVMNM